MDRCKRMKTASFCLPDDVLYIILLCLPADVLYNVMRFVCRLWYNVIQSPTFIASHLEKHSTSIALLLVRHLGNNGFVIRPRSHGGLVLEVKNLNYKFYHRACGSCNGLLFVLCPLVPPRAHHFYLFQQRDFRSYVVNPLTKQYLPLPPSSYSIERHSCSFGYAAASRVYKVMHYIVVEARCLILTVGVDKAWREIDAFFQLSEDAKAVMMSSHSHVHIRGFVYYLNRNFPFILCFDMETETFREIPLPTDQNGKIPSRSGLLAMDSPLSFWTWESTDKYLYNIWLLKDPDTGQWEKLIDLRVKHHCHPRPFFTHILPIGWLRSRELLVFLADAKVMVYNINTGEVHQTINMIRRNAGFLVALNCEFHVDSLVPLNNLSLATTAGRPHKSRDWFYSKENMMSEFEEWKP